jgi:predicted alpha/beta superfamily hydrolase
MICAFVVAGCTGEPGAGPDDPGGPNDPGGPGPGLPSYSNVDTTVVIAPGGHTLRRLTVASSVMGQSNRRIYLYLPPGYADQTRRYPVLYMNDGGELFAGLHRAGAPIFGVDTVASRLAAENLAEPVIIVGIEHADRTSELTYTPIAGLSGTGGGTKLLKFIVTELKPLIDQQYRTRPDRASTVYGGASAGGGLAVQGPYSYPAIFGGAVAMSSGIYGDSAKGLAQIQQGLRFKLFFSRGTNDGEPGKVLRDTTVWIPELIDAGMVRDVDFLYEVGVGDSHNQANWGRRTKTYLPWLFPI